MYGELPSSILKSMSERQKRGQSKQKTSKGQEIPVPKRGDFFRNLKKIAKPDSKGESRPKE